MRPLENHVANHDIEGPKGVTNGGLSTTDLCVARRPPPSSVDAGLRAHMLRVYNYMLVGLALTGAASPMLYTPNRARC